MKKIWTKIIVQGLV